jgi:hypothetical protein
LTAQLSQHDLKMMKKKLGRIYIKY